MKRIIYIPLTLLVTTPSFASEELHGDINLLLDCEDYYLGLSVENPSLDDESYELRGGQFGLG